ncbi:MAG: hypothetical protein AAGG07_01110 [Planctomycetota bacterium]
MRNLLAILLATAVALLPLQSRSVGDCCCAMTQNTVLSADGDAQAQAEPAQTCCALMAERRGTDRDQPADEDQDRPCSDGTCPSPCCFAKAVAATERVPSRLASRPTFNEPLAANAIGPGSPHLNQLRRPPRA